MAGVKLTVFLGSVRDGRNGNRVWKLVSSAAKELDLDVTLLDPLAMNTPPITQPLHFMKDKSAAPAWMLETNEVIKNSDAFLVISSEYNCSIPPALSNLMDQFPPASYRHRPSGIVCYSMGNYGGCRAAMLLRSFLSELGTVTVPAQATIPVVHQNISEEGEPVDPKWKAQVTRMLSELKFYAEAIKQQKTKAGLPQ
ncbi:unnamed protein product [Notodromas monacha]|uniref:NADPH-dependent FMN reductase-like domain-containing protein n=1 Tax=Notodromas monacha TaxID=399045 RepID=A0A7R9GAV7_9CRUS|nr:unnamed protein product [Notodromas monacha]CAG0915870.1 unnamed protein product [Notodromas monacha]